MSGSATLSHIHMGPWAGYLPSLSIPFLICKQGFKSDPPLKVTVAIKSLFMLNQGTGAGMEDWGMVFSQCSPLLLSSQWLHLVLIFLRNSLKRFSACHGLAV